MMSSLILQNYLYILIYMLLINIYLKDFVVASSCEVTYTGLDGDIYCRKTADSLENLNRNILVYKYKCDGEDKVYEYCPETSRINYFEINDCALTPDTFNFCNDYHVYSYSKASGDYKNVVLQNGTFRNRHKVYRIILSGNGIRTVESGAFGCEKNLRYLDMRNNDIEELPENSFQCLSGLFSLDLSKNRIILLPECLRDLYSLKQLFLNDNFITVFSENVLHKNCSLTDLKLNRNAIQKFCPAEISQLDDLSDLYLRGNNITSLTNKCFFKHKRLWVLDIGMNVGLVLANDVFAGMDELKTLRIDGCGLSIGVGGSAMFSDTISLTKLHLQHNRLREIYSNFFQKLRKLEHLDLSFNAISVLHNGSFAKNDELNYLDLSYNDLREIKNGEFSRLNKLLFLSISNNHITNLAENAFNNLKSLKTLSIRNNHISPMMVQSSVPMYDFQNIFNNLDNLETLDMSNITSRKLKLVFPEKNKNIRYLDISFNVGLRLQKISLKNLTSLRTFISQGTNVKHLKGLFKSNKQLEEINLSLNKIQEVDRLDLMPVENLRKLDLSSNSISRIHPLVFRFSKKLEYVNVSHNDLKVMGVNLLPQYRRLNDLDISSNRFVWIHWKDFALVDNLWASNNKVEDLFLSDLVNLKIQAVHLEDCKIQRVHLHSKIEIESVTNSERTQIFLARNPFVCDCHAFQLYEYMKHHGVNSRFSLEGLKCRDPTETRGRKMKNLLSGEFSCDVNRSCPETCRCLKRAHDNALVVNCSRRDLGRIPKEVPINTTILDVSYNRITSLESLNSSIWETLTEIHAEGNFISSLEFEVPKSVKIFLLHNNRLTKLPEKHTALTRRSLEITLSKNPWSCGCESLTLKYFLLKPVGQIPDATEVRCAPSTNSTSNLTLLETKDYDLCFKGEKKAVFISLITILSVIVFGLSVWLYCNKNEDFINAVLYTHCNCMYSLLDCKKVIEEDKTFDCFISYGSEDVEVPLAIVRELGKEPDPEFKFCVHDRHWRGGSTISENIFRSVEISRKTLIVVSQTFVKNRWFHLEFQAALMQMLKDRQDRMIFAIKGDLPDYEDLPRDVRHFLRTRTYLVWGERWFMEKLRYSLQREHVPLSVQLKKFLLVVGKCFRNKRVYHWDGLEEIV